MSIRTTVTLDEDVLLRVQDESKNSGRTFRNTLNELVRDGLAAGRQRKTAKKKFVIKPHRFGLKPGLSYDSISTLLSIGEGEDHR